MGRQPALGLAELESLYGAKHIRPAGGQAALLDIPAEDIDFNRLGGTIKTARILSTLPSHNWRAAFDYLSKAIPEHLQHIEGKLTLGISVYGLDVDTPKLNRDLLALKKIIKQTGKPVRIVPNKELALNSAQILHNKLTHKGGWELLLVRDGNQTILAQTLFVQDIEAYAARDQMRPKRDARVGMLPPKLAQIIVNLATGPLNSAQGSQPEGVQGADETHTEPYGEYGEGASQSATPQSPGRTSRVDGSAGKQARAVRVLDPFCGTGVIMQEAMLMGYHVLGSDIDERMIEYTKANLEWLVEKNPKIETTVAVEVGDATTHIWPSFSAVASEVYLGRPLNFLPRSEELQQIISDVNTITKKFLVNLSGQLKSGQTISLAVPAWRVPRKEGYKHVDAALGVSEKHSKTYVEYGARASKRATTRSAASNGGVSGSAAKQTDAMFISLPVIDHLTDMGYTQLDLKHVRRDELIYFRENQVVARRILRLSKK